MNKILFSSNSEEWETPQYFFDDLNNKYNFTLDPCCTDENAKCKKHYTKKENGLFQTWENEIVFCNPPYGRAIPEWIKKAVYESENNHAKVVMLIPARTDTKYFHDYIYNKPNIEIIFLRGRLKFGGAKNSAPFPSMLVIFGGE